MQLFTETEIDFQFYLIENKELSLT